MNSKAIELVHEWVTETSDEVITDLPGGKYFFKGTKWLEPKKKSVAKIVFKFEENTWRTDL